MASVMEPGRRAHRRRWRRASSTTTIRVEAPVEPEMELTLPARAESLAIVRDALRALGGVLALEQQLLADICLAVTEACTNVVLHAYPDGEDGPLEILVWNGGPREGGDDPAAHARDVERAEDELTVVVGDCGRGTHAPASTPGLGLGLRLISALTKSARVSSSDEGRTEVEMTFSLAASSPSSALSMSNATASPR